MKKRRVLLLCLVGLLCLTACRFGASEPTPPTASSPFTQTETDQDIQVSTPYFTLTFPVSWKDQFKIRYTETKNSLHYRLVDPVSEADHGGHYFTVSLFEDPIQAAEICCYTGSYLGVLQAEKTYTVVVEHPTDLPVGEERKDLYLKLLKTRQQVLNTFAPASGANYISTGTANYMERAALLKTKTTASEVAERFTRDTGTTLTYVGLCADLLTYDEGNQILPRDKHTHYLYRDSKGNPYLIPLFFAGETHTVLPTVYRVDQFPHVSAVWGIDHTLFDRKAKEFAKAAQKDWNQYCLKDLNGEGVPELLMMENTELLVHTFQEDSFVLKDRFDGVTATMTYHYWYGIDFPGLFTVSVGGGQTHYGYLSYRDGTLSHQAIATKDSPDPDANLPVTVYDDAFAAVLQNQLPELIFQKTE